MINFIKNLLQFGSFKIHFIKIQLSFVISRKISQNSVNFSQFQDTFNQKHHKYRQILRYLCKINIFCKFPNFSTV